MAADAEEAARAQDRLRAHVTAVHDVIGGWLCVCVFVCVCVCVCVCV